jgi:hypothetical protein
MSEGYLRQRRFYEDRSKDSFLAATDTGKADIATVRNASHTLYIQRIVYVPSTVSATALTIQDDAGTPLVIGLIPASQATPYVIEFGPTGRALTEGKNLDITAAGAGPAGTIHVEAYNKLTAAAVTAP